MCSTEHQIGRDSSDGDSFRIYVIVLSCHVEPNESERPVPKSIVVEQGMHPHPGPGGDVTAAEAFEYCCQYTLARLREVQRNADPTDDHHQG